MKLLSITIIISMLLGCADDVGLSRTLPPKTNGVSLVVLGTIQDAGSPHIACKKECCANLFENPDKLRKVVSLGVVDHTTNRTFLFEATPDITTQVKKLKSLSNSQTELPSGVFLTHAHIGHYAGLMYLGKEATNASEVPVYAMPRMKTFLETNGPWSQLVANKNIVIKPLTSDESVKVSESIEVVPFTVPHRDEFSETVGYLIVGPTKTALFIPDIDKWGKWEEDISDVIKLVDYAFLDATFYDGNEINNRDISEIPHPFIIESMKRFEGLTSEEKKKIYFIHFNHTNPVINQYSGAYKEVLNNGFNVAKINDVLVL